MRKELVFLWINQDINHCFHHMGFNFSPLFNVSFNSNQKNLKIERTDKFNVFSNGSLTNITAVIGENGTGKTTLLQLLTALSNVPINSKFASCYKNEGGDREEYKKFLAVYYEKDSPDDIKIINKTGSIIYMDGTEIESYSREDYQKENYIGQISHIYISNSEYTGNRNLHSDGIDHITLSNEALKSIFSSFFASWFHAPTQFIIEDSTFHALQSILQNKMTTKNAQMILDLMYQNYMLHSKANFCGKRVEYIQVKITDISSLIPEEAQTIGYQSEYAELSFIEKFYKNLQRESYKIKKEIGSDISERLITNLLGELIFVYDFNLTGEDLTIGDIYEQCERYIDKEITTSSEKLYYQSALREIDAIKRLITKEDCIDDPTLQRAGIRSTLYETEVGELWQIINESINVGNSFILKYLDVQNLEMSSGERALLNFMSRIYLASQINYIMPDRSFQLHENILLLIDEIDLYLHPEWQRRIVSDLISELNQCFPGHYFQIILTSHSPIVLSDIPRDNSIFLKRIEEQIVQTSREIQTFGANIHMLYRDAFFLENGLAVGEYAQNYINQLITDIRERNITDEEANKKIAIIGEPIIKKKITQMLEHPQKNIVSQNQDTRQQMLAFFRKQKEEIERQIRNLEKGVI